MSDGKADLRWILWPAVITLLVTILRAVGEAQGWSETLFGTAPGGQISGEEGEGSRGISLIGITVLVPIFGLWFGGRLSRRGLGPVNRGRALLFSFLGLAIMIGSLGAAFSTIQYEGTGPDRVILETPIFPWALIGAFVVSWIGAMVARRGWSELWCVLAAYGWAARIPVIVVTFILCFMNLGTHYEKPHPAIPSDLPVFARASLLSLAQVGFWVPFTIGAGMVFAALAAFVVKPKET